MRRKFFIKLLFPIILITALFLVVWLQAFSFVRAAIPNDVWVSTNNTIAEYTQDGTLLTSSIPVLYGGGTRPITEDSRDLIVGSKGVIHIYDGTFDPYLSLYYPITNTWTHETYLGWSTVNNVSYGGIARYHKYIFLTDMETFGDGGADEAKGIVRFDTGNDSFLRFADTIEFIDLNMGLDGLLYALRSNETSVDVYDPLTNNLVRTLNLGTGVRGIAVNEEGDIFGASWDDNIYHFDANGIQLNSVNSGATDLTDIDITCDGQIAVGARFGEVIFSDESLTTVTSFDTGGSPTFVAFSDPRISCVYLPIIIR